MNKTKISISLDQTTVDEVEAKVLTGFYRNNDSSQLPQRVYHYDPFTFDADNKWCDKIFGKDRPRRRDPAINAIVRDGGDLSKVYESKFHLLPEVLDPFSFQVTSTQPALVVKDDFQLIEGYWSFLKYKMRNDYLIVDIGHAHLPGVAYNLLSSNIIDCYFAIPQPINKRFHETIKYWALEYDVKKRQCETPEGLATLIDIHRNDSTENQRHKYQLNSSHFPSAKRLKELGIERIVYLSESPVGFVEQPIFPEDLAPILKTYQTEGLPIVEYGIDARQGQR